MTLSDDGTAPFKVLVVCRANICRSPTAQLMLSRCLSAQGIAEYVDLSSAGVTAVRGQPWCEAGAAGVGKGDDRTTMQELHRSRRLHRDMVEQADLVLTATRQERAAVVQLLPTATVRTFTLKESAVLAGAVAHAMVQQDAREAEPGRALGVDLKVPPLPLGLSPPERLRWLTSEMHSARGLVRVPTAEAGRGGWWPRRHKDDRAGIDIADPHGPERARHRPAQILHAVQAWSLAASLVVRLGAEVSPD